MSGPRITDERLLAYAGGELTPEDAEAVEAYLNGHPEAARRVALYRIAAKRTAEDASVAPPAEAVARAKAVFRQRAARPALDWTRAVAAAIARLVYDSRLQPAAVRYRGTGDRFELSFELDGEPRAEIDLQAERLPPDEGRGRAERWRLLGQVSAERAPGEIEIAAILQGAADPCETTRSDERAVFTLDLPGGCYELRLKLEDAVVVVPDVRLE